MESLKGSNCNTIPLYTRTVIARRRRPRLSVIGVFIERVCTVRVWGCERGRHAWRRAQCWTPGTVPTQLQQQCARSELIGEVALVRLVATVTVHPAKRLGIALEDRAQHETFVYSEQ